MLINSFQFLFFFTIVFICYWLLQRKSKIQNVVLLVASYVFYGVANWKMCVLLLIATTIFYIIGLLIEKYNDKKDQLASLFTSIGVVLGIGLLLYFKYLNFFIQSFADLFNMIGLYCNPATFNIIMPIGISFFTFKLISYVIEVRNEGMSAAKSFVDFATYVAFFPTIMSGPIDRPNLFIPQLQKPRELKSFMIVDGFKQILWGMVLKMCIADRISLYTSAVFDNVPNHNGLTILIACLLYSIEMYTDFAGYSDMAIGVGKLLGINVTENFNYPFFGRNIAEFWRRWHMSLTTWVTDYVYTPLSFSFRKYGKYGISFAIILNFIIIGFWHGADWAYGIYGLYHGLLFVPLIFSGAFADKTPIKKYSSNIPYVSEFLKMALTFMLVTIGLIIFREGNLTSAFNVFAGIGTPWDVPFTSKLSGIAIGLIVLLIHDFHHGLGVMKQFLDKVPALIKIALYYIFIGAFGVLDGDQFIYFQF